MENSSERTETLSRRDVLRAGAAAGLALPALGGGVAATAIGALTSPARAATAGQCVLGVTQEAVNFNPLLYVNTGVETSVEFIVFDNLWKTRSGRKVRAKPRRGDPDSAERRNFGGRPDLDDKAASRRNLA